MTSKTNGVVSPVRRPTYEKAAWRSLVLVLVAGGAAAFMYMRVNQPYRGYEGAEQFVEIPPGAGQRRHRRSADRRLA